MEGISRANLDRICELLQNHINTEESIKLGKILKDFDAIPKLYAFTYFNKVFQELKLLKGEDSIDMDEFETMAEQFDALNLHMFKTKTEVNKLFGFLNTGMERMKMFCDFDDSKFHKQTMMGQCDNDQHLEDPNLRHYLNDEEREDFDNICRGDGGWDEATKKYMDKLWPEELLKPVWFPDEDSHKWDDEPQWFCSECLDRLDGGDCDFEVSCDMDLGE